MKWNIFLATVIGLKVCVIYLLLKIFDIWDNDLGQRTNGNRPPLGGKISGK